MSTRGKTLKARSNPRYFGLGQGVTFYTWTSDQFSQYGSKAIPTTLRDATFVLDAILCVTCRSKTTLPRPRSGISGNRTPLIPSCRI